MIDYVELERTALSRAKEYQKLQYIIQGDLFRLQIRFDTEVFEYFKKFAQNESDLEKLIEIYKQNK